jgi:Na+(H+)/acetate symporter ActP
VQIRLGWSPADTLWWGIEPVSAAVFAVPLGFLVGWVFSKALPSQKLL